MHVVQLSKLAPLDEMQLANCEVMHLSTNWFLREGVGGGIGAGGSVGDGGRVGCGTTTSSLRKRLRVMPSTSPRVPSSWYIPRTFPAETEDAMKAAVAPRRAKVFLMNMVNDADVKTLKERKSNYPFARQSQLMEVLGDKISNQLGS